MDKDPSKSDCEEEESMSEEKEQGLFEEKNWEI
jgi:hypothetical protein